MSILLLPREAIERMWMWVEGRKKRIDIQVDERGRRLEWSKQTKKEEKRRRNGIKAKRRQKG
jgi:hypothetical protein